MFSKPSALSTDVTVQFSSELNLGLHCATAPLLDQVPALLAHILVLVASEVRVLEPPFWIAGPSNHCSWSTAQRGWLVAGSLVQSGSCGLCGLARAWCCLLFSMCWRRLSHLLCVLLGSTCSASPLWELSFCFFLAITQVQVCEHQASCCHKTATT